MLGLLLGIVLYYAVVNWADTAARLTVVAAGLIGAGLGLALLAPLAGGIEVTRIAALLPPVLTGLGQRLTDAVNPNVLAGALTLLAPLALGLFLFRPARPWLRILAGLGALVMIGIIALTRSRGAWLALAAATLLLVTLRWRRGWLALPLGAAAGGVMLWQIGLPRAADLLMATQALGGAEQRLEIWSRALYMIQDFPFTGIGMGTFQQVANLLYPFFLAGPDAEVPHAHNIFLQVGVDLGLPGLIGWLALFGLVGVAAWRVYRWGFASENKHNAGLGAGLLASQVALLVHGLTDAPLWGTRPAVIVWIGWGLTMACLRLLVPTPVHRGGESF